MLGNKNTSHTHALFQISTILPKIGVVTYSAHTHRCHGNPLVRSPQLGQRGHDLSSAGGAEGVSKGAIHVGTSV